MISNHDSSRREVSDAVIGTMTRALDGRRVVMLAPDADGAASIENALRDGGVPVLRVESGDTAGMSSIPFGTVLVVDAAGMLATMEAATAAKAHAPVALIDFIRSTQAGSTVDHLMTVTPEEALLATTETVNRLIDRMTEASIVDDLGGIQFMPPRFLDRMTWLPRDHVPGAYRHKAATTVHSSIDREAGALDRLFSDDEMDRVRRTALMIVCEEERQASEMLGRPDLPAAGYDFRAQNDAFEPSPRFDQAREGSRSALTTPEVAAALRPPPVHITTSKRRTAMVERTMTFDGLTAGILGQAIARQGMNLVDLARALMTGVGNSTPRPRTADGRRYHWAEFTTVHSATGDTPIELVAGASDFESPSAHRPIRGLPHFWGGVRHDGDGDHKLILGGIRLGSLGSPQRMVLVTPTQPLLAVIGVDLPHTMKVGQKPGKLRDVVSSPVLDAMDIDVVRWRDIDAEELGKVDMANAVPALGAKLKRMQAVTVRI